MWLNVVSWLCVLYAVYVALTSNYSLHDKYYEMPKLFEVDDYEQCMEKSDSLFCSVRIQLHNDPLGPDKHNTVWNTIQEVNWENKKYFRHDIVLRGVCLSDKCSITKDSYLHLMEKDQGHFLEILNKCVSPEFREKYHLDTNVSIDNCQYHNQQRDITPSQWSFLCVVCLLVVLSFVGCFVQKGDSKQSLSRKVLLAFSLRNNWNILLYKYSQIENNSKSSGNYLHGIQGMRTCLMIFVICSHIFFFLANSYLDNPEFMELLFGSDNSKLYYNGPVLMQSFLCISGFLLAFNFFKIAQTLGDVSFKLYPTFILQRYLRFTPVYVLTLGYICLWSRHVTGDYPTLNLFTMEERACKKYWLNNLLYINNRNHDTIMCMPHTWYLAVDTQLYCIMILILILLWKMRSYAKYILGGSLLISSFIISYITYVNDNTPFMILSPEVIRTVFENERTFQDVYVKAFSNSPGYIVGIIGAYICYQSNEQMTQSKYYVEWLEKRSKSIAQITLCVIYSGALMLNNTAPGDVYNGGLIVALYSSLNRVVMSIGFVIFLIAMATKTQYFLKNFLESRVLIFLGSLTYSALMIHIAVQTHLLTSMEMIHLSFFSIAKYLIYSVFVTYMIALVVCLVVEMPFYNLQKLIFGLNHEKRETKTK